MLHQIAASITDAECDMIVSHMRAAHLAIDANIDRMVLGAMARSRAVRCLSGKPLRRRFRPQRRPRG